MLCLSRGLGIWHSPKLSIPALAFTSYLNG
jgi:hypothetical protein